jgi:hypothetical protein
MSNGMFDQTRVKRCLFSNTSHETIAAHLQGSRGIPVAPILRRGEIPVKGP